jgi:hypothetical protein
MSCFVCLYFDCLERHIERYFSVFVCYSKMQNNLRGCSVGISDRIRDLGSTSFSRQRIHAKSHDELFGGSDNAKAITYIYIYCCYFCVGMTPVACGLTLAIPFNKECAASARGLCSTFRSASPPTP